MSWRLCCRFLIQPYAWAYSRQHTELSVLGSEGRDSSPCEPQDIATPPLQLSSRGKWFAWLVAKAVFTRLFPGSCQALEAGSLFARPLKQPLHCSRAPVTSRVAPPGASDQGQLPISKLHYLVLTSPQTVLEARTIGPLLFN